MLTLSRMDESLRYFRFRSENKLEAYDLVIDGWMAGFIELVFEWYTS